MAMLLTTCISMVLLLLDMDTSSIGVWYTIYFLGFIVNYSIYWLY